METLSDETWDVVIAGTSIPQSLLALALSRSDKKVLHVDRNDYYGGEDAGLSLTDAEQWIERLQQTASTSIKDASIFRPDPASSQSSASLSSSRSYTLSLNPQIIYAQSEFLPTLVSSRIHTQLEFLAVGAWWVLRDGRLHKIPGTREDVFNDESLSMKDKRGLMKFLRYVLQEDGETSTAPEEQDPQMSLETALSTKFKVPESLQAPLLALALSPVQAKSTPFNEALARIRRHMRSMGYFGQGFGAVIPKYGGNSEISQVACRAQAVGGGIYLLGHGLESMESPAQEEEMGSLIQSKLTDGTKIRSRHLVGSLEDLPKLQDVSGDQEPNHSTWRSINVIASPLKSLFPPTSENGPNPAVAIVLVDDKRTESGSNPIYLQMHSEDTGECPADQCIIYASVVSEDASAQERLKDAVASFLASLDAKDTTLWSLSYRKLGPATSTSSKVQKPSPQVMLFPPRPPDIAFDDTILSTVREAWETILGAEVASQNTFLRFEERESELEE